jgi:hypothetical protein
LETQKPMVALTCEELMTTGGFVVMRTMQAPSAAVRAVGEQTLTIVIRRARCQ